MSVEDRLFVVDLTEQVAGKDRYSFSRFMGNRTPQRSAELHHNPLPIFDPNDSYFLTQLMKLPSKGTFQISAQVQEYRPDNISLSIYGSNMYWQIVLWYNKIRKYSELSIGKSLKFPSQVQVEELYFSLKAQDVLRSRISSS